MEPSELKIRALDEMDIGGIVRIDERLSGKYRPEVWERRIGYYLRRDPESSQVAEVAGKVVGFMLGEVRSGEFGLEEATGWIEVLGIDPDHQGRAIGRRLLEAMLPHLQARGATQVRTLVDDSMPGIASFFERVGFTPAPSRAFALSLSAPSTAR